MYEFKAKIGPTKIAEKLFYEAKWGFSKVAKGHSKCYQVME